MLWAYSRGGEADAVNGSLLGLRGGRTKGAEFVVKAEDTGCEEQELSDDQTISCCDIVCLGDE